MEYRTTMSAPGGVMIFWAARILRAHGTLVSDFNH